MAPKKIQKTKRNPPRRSGNPRILILCEGEKTEPNYFKNFKEARRLTNVVVLPPRQVGPAGLLKRVREELGHDSDWDEIYCVLDHDGRDREIATFESQLTALNNQTDSCRIAMVLSNPCFEFWLLLHFEFTNRPFSAGVRRVACENVIRKLKRHLPKYQKNDAGIFERCREHVDTALENSMTLQQAESHSAKHSAPHTDVGQLIKRLLKLSNI